MKYTGPVVVWLVLVATTIVEVLVFLNGPGTYSVDAGIGVIALINVVIIALFSMNIRKEPSPVQYLMLAPLILVMGLILAMLFIFVH